MVALYIVMCLISMGTLGSEGMITLDDVLAEMSSMRNDMDDKMSSMRSDMDDKMSSLKNDMDDKMSSMKNDMDDKMFSMRSNMEEVSEMMNNRLNKLLRQVEDLRDIHLPSKTTSPTLPPTTTTPTTPTLPTQTTTPTPPTLPRQPSACSSYTELSDAWRHIDYVNRGTFRPHCDSTGSSSSYTNLGWGSWYRFTGAAGNKLPTAPAPVGGGFTRGNRMCETNGVAWMKGGNPTIQDGIVTRDVCFELSSDSCWSKTTIGVAACRDMHGDYFVYQLQQAPCSPCAYCAID